jgi:phage shock protein A
MALIRRVSRLFAADMHAVLDQIEEPEVVLRQAIREMEEELARQNQRRKWLRAEIESAASRIEALMAHCRDIDAKLDISFASENEAVARRLTRRKLETTRLREHTDAKREALGRQLDELDALVATNADQLEGMRQKAEVLAIDESVALRSGDEHLAAIDDDDVEIAFLREKQARVSS